MPALNVLLAGSVESPALELLFKSKYLNKLYTNFELPNIPDIRFNTFKELAKKCKALKIDLVLVDDEKFILQGIADVLRANFVNCFAINSFWTQLVLSNDFAHKMCEKYGIETPEIFKYPQEYPLIVRADGVREEANSLQDIININKKIVNCSQEISDKEIAEDLIKEYNSKLQNMFLAENSNFIGYINSEVILKEQALFNIGFNLNFPVIKEDLLYLLISVIYQKLTEITLR